MTAFIARFTVGHIRANDRWAFVRCGDVVDDEGALQETDLDVAALLERRPPAVGPVSPRLSELGRAGRVIRRYVRCTGFPTNAHPAPRPMRRLSLIMLPFLAAFSLVFGLYYLYAAFRLVQLGRMVPAALVLVFGVVGVGLAVAIWVARKRVIGTSGRTNTSGGQPTT